MAPTTLTGQTHATSLGLFTVRPMFEEEVSLATDWAAIEGWNPGDNDAACFHAADPHGFFVGLLDGQPIGCCSAVTYDNSYAFFGLFIVRPEYRGQGFGRRLAEAATAYTAGRNVGLDGVVDMQCKYVQHGYRAAHRNIRYQGTCEGRRAKGILPLALVPLETVVAYDRVHFSAARGTFVKEWISQPGSTSLGFVERGSLQGYGVLRPCQAGYKIGPLFADSEPIAEALFEALCEHASGETVYLDTPEVNPGAVFLAERHGMTPVFETARMYNGQEPDVPLGEIFGVTTFELG